MEKEKYELLLEKLRLAGWYEGRNIKNEVNSPYNSLIYPSNVLNFFYEFGNLSVQNIPPVKSGYWRTPEINLSFSARTYDYYHNYKIDTPDLYPIQKNTDDSEYYYSVLIGKQLYFVFGADKEDTLLFMDELNNFYLIHYDIPCISWIGNNALEVLYNIFFGGFPNLGLNEHILKWERLLSEESDYKPPINKDLNGINPFE